MIARLEPLGAKCYYESVGISNAALNRHKLRLYIQRLSERWVKARDEVLCDGGRCLTFQRNPMILIPDTDHNVGVQCLFMQAEPGRRNRIVWS